MSLKGCALGASMAAVVAIAWGAPAAAQSKDLAVIFGARPFVEQASISPDGTKIAFVEAREGQASAVMLVDLNDAQAVPKGIAAVSGKPDRLSRCQWTSNVRLLCSIYGIVRLQGEIAYTNRLIGLDVDGKRMKALPMPRGYGVTLFGGAVLDSNSGTDDHVLMMRSNLPIDTTGTRLGSERRGMSVELVDTVTMHGQVVERIDPSASEYITDGNGVIRIVGRNERNSSTGYLTGRTHYSYRKAGETRWTPMSTVLLDGSGFNPYGVDPTTNTAYGLRRHEGRMAAFRMALDGTGREELVYAHPEVDVSGFVRIGRRGRIVGVRYTTDSSQVHYIDPELDRLAVALSKALPHAPLIRFVDSSEDENIILMWAGGDTDAGRYYLFDRKGRKLEPLMPDRPGLEGMKLAEMKPITYRASDGTMVPGYLTLPVDRPARGLPAIVLPHGGPGARDVWGFDWLAHYFAAEGFAVLQPNFRGSAGYGDAWFQENGFKSWETAIGDVNDAGRHLIREGIADPAKLGVFGWSYGGYAALQSAALDPDLFKAVVAVAPVTDLSTLREEGRSFSNFRIQADFIGNGPHIRAGSPVNHAASFKAPVLMFHGDLDRNVGVNQAKRMQSRLQSAGKQSELVIYEGLDHYLEDSSVRAEMLKKSSDFLRSSMGL